MKNINANWLKFEKTLSESQKRWLARLLAMEIGYGGVNEVAEAMKISPTTVIKGKKEVTGQMDLSTDRIRNVGGGRKNSLDNNKLISVWSKRDDFSINPAFQAVFFVTFCSIYLSNIRVGTLIFT